MKTRNLTTNSPEEEKPLSIQVTSVGGDKSLPYIAIDPDSKFIVTGSHDKTIRIWNFQGSLLKKIDLPYIDFFTRNGVRGISIHPNGKHIISTNIESRLQIWSIESCLLAKKFVAYDRYDHLDCCDYRYDIIGHTFAISPCGNYIASGKSILNLNNGKRLSKLKIEHSHLLVYHQPALPICISSDGSFVAKVNAYHHLPIFDLREFFYSIAIYDLKSGQHQLEFEFCEAAIHAIAISFNRYFIVSGSADKIIRVYDIEQGMLVKKLGGHADQIRSVNISPDDRFIVSGSDDRTVRIWDVETGNLLKTLEGHSSCVLSVAISPDEQHLVSSCAVGKMLIWNFNVLINSLKKTNKISECKDIAVNTGLLKNFIDVLSDPNLMSLDLICSMFAKVNSIEAFKLPYTLANIEFHQHGKHQEAVQLSVYQCLKELADSCITSDNEKSSFCIAQYKLAVDSALKKGFITKAQKYFLNDKAENNRTFSDERFLSLKRDVDLLKEQVKVTMHNVNLLAKNFESLKDALRHKMHRDMFFAVAKLSLGFFGGPLVDLMAHVYDFSSISEVMAGILKIEINEWDQWIEKGADAIKEHLDVEVVETIVNLGYDLDELISVCIHAPEQLKSAPLISFESKAEAKTIVSTQPMFIKAFNQKLNDLMDRKFTFMLKRQANNSLLIQFTAANSLLMTVENLRQELIMLVQLFEKTFMNSDLKTQQFQMEPNWEKWTLAVAADSSTLYRIEKILCDAGAKYFSSQAQVAAFFKSHASELQSAVESDNHLSCAIQ